MEMLTINEREFILEEMRKLLNEYDYSYDNSALNDIIDEWASQKAEIIKAFKTHPNYVEGKFLIAFTQGYEREINGAAIEGFRFYLRNFVMNYSISTLPEDIKQQMMEENTALLPQKLFELLVYDFNTTFNCRVINEETAQKLEKIIPQIHPHAGQKTTRVVNKICQYLNYDKHENYNREYAKFADALSPIQIKRHTILSINPLDYLTMSFGNSWSSCHTIDKLNKRHMPNSYEGMYSSGTMSYMLDGTSMVFYTVDSAYEGTDYWTQPKINRQMYHYGEEKLIQSRLYPQSNDGCGDVYTPYRNIVQEIMAKIYDFPNLWTLHKGTSKICDYVCSEGTHYRDYTSFDSCTLSRIMDSLNEEPITIGASPICIQCGCRHDTENNINCCDSGRYCEHCGAHIRYEDDECWAGDYCYCSDCVTWCPVCEEYELNDDMYWVERENRSVCRHCIDSYYYRCYDCDEYVHEDDVYYIEDRQVYVCPECIGKYYYCEDCGCYYSKDSIHRDEFGDYYCDDCWEERKEEDEE